VSPFNPALLKKDHVQTTFNDIDPYSVRNFLRMARLERQFPLPDNKPLTKLLAHLHLFSSDHLLEPDFIMRGGEFTITIWRLAGSG